MKKSTLFLLIITTLPASADSVYKCDIKGVTTFSQQPCDDKQEKIIIKLKPGNNAIIAPQASPASPNKTSEQHLDEIRNYQIEQEIKRNSRTIRHYEKKMTKELKILKTRTTYATNSLAGAIYQESLSSEMIAVTQKYSTLIDGLKSKNHKLKNQQLTIQ
jgi:phosphatidate phosphatase PAH1